MRTVYKYDLTEIHKIPHSATLVHAGRDPAGELCAWYDVDTSNSPQTVAFQVIGTGQEIPRGAQHVITTKDGPFMWHFYAIYGSATHDR